MWYIIVHGLRYPILLCPLVCLSEYMKLPFVSQGIEKSQAKKPESTTASRVIPPLTFVSHFTHEFPIYDSSNVAQRGELASFLVRHKCCRPVNNPYTRLQLEQCNRPQQQSVLYQ